MILRVLLLLLLIQLSLPGPGAAEVARGEKADLPTSILENSLEPVTGSLLALEIARSQLGVRYKYGGIGPKKGFDCSGLVRYAFGKAGLDLPRTSREMYRQAKAVALEALKPGDLLFFRISKNIRTHVAIYAGEGRFIHAASKGKDVQYGKLSEPYWRKRLIQAGRWPEVAGAPPMAASTP